MFIIKYNDLGTEPRYLVSGGIMTTKIYNAKKFETKELLKEYAYMNAPSGYLIESLDKESE